MLTTPAFHPGNFKVSTQAEFHHAISRSIKSTGNVEDHGPGLVNVGVTAHVLEEIYMSKPMRNCLVICL